MITTALAVTGGCRMAESKKVSEQTTKLNWKQNVVMYLHDLVYLLMGLMVVFLVMFRLIVVSGDSMYSTLVDGDYLLLLSNVFYQEPEHGDIIVISKQNFDNGAPIVKRVIASEGQIVDIDFERGIVYVDGLPLEEDYINSPTTVYEGVNFPVIVEEGCFFVLGDNRGVSKDSRSPEIGFVDRREILGKAIFLLLPGTNHGMSAQEFDRIGVIK
jgi:signal peptidase I